MKKIRYISKFTFDYAQYFISDQNNNEVLLSIDYKNNKFHISKMRKNIRGGFRQEIKLVALNLLMKKHGINRVKYLKIS